MYKVDINISMFSVLMGYNIFDSDPLNYSAGETIHL